MCLRESNRHACRSSIRDGAMERRKASSNVSSAKGFLLRDFELAPSFSTEETPTAIEIAGTTTSYHVHCWRKVKTSCVDRRKLDRQTPIEPQLQEIRPVRELDQCMQLRSVQTRIRQQVAHGLHSSIRGVRLQSIAWWLNSLSSWL